jgi:hypothetical protein
MIIVVLLAVALISGCATTAGYRAVMDTWTDNYVENLFYKWGYPHSSFAAPNGNTVYVYESSRNYTTPVYATTNTTNTGDAYTSMYGGNVINMRCRTYFEVDNETKRIVAWRFQGNDCTAVAPKKIK